MASTQKQTERRSGKRIPKPLAAKANGGTKTTVGVAGLDELSDEALRELQQQIAAKIGNPLPDVQMVAKILRLAPIAEAEVATEQAAQSDWPDRLPEGDAVAVARDLFGVPGQDYCEPWYVAMNAAADELMLLAQSIEADSGTDGIVFGTVWRVQNRLRAAMRLADADDNYPPELEVLDPIREVLEAVELACHERMPENLDRLWSAVAKWTSARDALPAVQS